MLNLQIVPVSQYPYTDVYECVIVFIFILVLFRYRRR